MATATRPVRKSPVRRAAEDLGVLLVLAPLICAAPLTVVWSIWSEAAALQAEWTVKGEPCPVVARPSRTAVSPRKPPITFQYGEISFTRSFAAASCAAPPENPLWPRESYRVCQFNNPGAIAVATGGQRIVFEPPAGRRATVTVRRGRITCVVGGTFNL